MNPFIRKTKYKDRPAISVESDKAIAVFLPQDGGKLASVRMKCDGWEFLTQTPNEHYRVLTYDGSYVDAECSACDEMFPTIDPCTPTEEFGAYPDHGEVCRMPHDVQIDDSSVTLYVKSEKLSYTYQKQISCDELGNFVLDYTISNPTPHAFPNLWAMHCMLRGESSAKLLLPYTEGAPTEIMFGPENAEELPKDKLIPYQPGGATYKYYFLEPMTEGMCGCEYAVNGHRFVLEFDPKKIPYLGVWLNSGGFKDMYNLALEPCTSPFDTPVRASERNCGSVLESSEMQQFSIKIIVE